jgi:hypothetical protein
VRWLRAPRTHLILTLIWVVLLWPTLTVWRDSVPWVGIMSWWAIVISHWTTYVAARADVAAEAVEKQTGSDV